MGAPESRRLPARGKPRSRTADLAIAATANVYGETLITLDLKDFKIVDDLVDVRAP